MQRSKIPSPARSEGVRMTPRRHRFRSSRSVSSPARSDVSVKLSSIVKMHAMNSPALSPLKPRRSVLSDNTDIEVPERESWWKRLEDNSRDVMEVFESKTTDQPDNVEEYIEVDFKSQENNYTIDLPESSDGESIRSIVLPQRKFFSQKQTHAHELFNKIIENRENLTHRKSKANTDNTIFVGKKNLFNRGTEERNRPVFPAGLLNITDKTLINKTHDITNHKQVRNLLGNRAGTKRKNMFAQFIMSESEDEIPDIQPNVFGFSKLHQKQQNKTSTSQGTRNNSPTSNETDLEFDDWQHLPSSTMVDSDFGNIESSPVKRPRLSKPYSVIETVQGNVRNKLDKTKQTVIVSHGSENENNEVKEKSDNKNSKNINERTLNKNENTLRQSIAEIIQVDSDDGNDFTLRYENDDKNMQENDENDITVKDLENVKSNTNENNLSKRINNTENLINSPNSLKGSETKGKNKSNLLVSVETMEASEGTKMINLDKSKNVSWKIVETHQEQHAAIDIRENLHEKDVNKKINTSPSTTNRKDACDEKDNREISIERVKDTAMNTAQEKDGTAVIERKQKDVVQEEVKSKNSEDTKVHQSKAQEQINKSIEQIQKSSGDEIMDVEEDLNENPEEGINNEINSTHDTESPKEKETDYISEDIENVENVSAEKNYKETTTTQTHATEKKEYNEVEVNNEKIDKLKESKKESVKEIPIDAMEEKNNTNYEDNREAEVEKHRAKDDNVMHVNESNKESQQVSITSMSEDQEGEDEENRDDNNENEEIEDDVDNAKGNENQEFNEQMTSLDENIEKDDEESHKDDDEEDNAEDIEPTDHEKSDEMASVEENVLTEGEKSREGSEEENPPEVDDEEDIAEEREIPNEMNEQTDKQTGVSSMDVNVETEDEENPEDSDEARSEDDDENNAEENEMTEENNDETDNQVGIASINKSTETENEENFKNNEGDDEEENHAEDNELENESNEENGNRMPSAQDNSETDDEDNNVEENEEMNVEEEKHSNSDAKPDNQVTFSKGRIYLTNITGESTHSYADEVAEESDHEESITRQLALEQYLMKIKNDNIEKRRKMEEEVRDSLKATSRETFNHFKVPSRPRPTKSTQRADIASGQTKTKAKKITSLFKIENLPPELLDDMKYKPPRRYQPKNAAWITKRLYKYLETKLEPKYDYKARLKAEKLVEAIYEFSKEVRRHKVAPPTSVDLLKQQLARTGIVSTHYDFYKFFHEFMPREIRVKVVPDVVNEIPLPRHGVFSDIV